MMTTLTRRNRLIATSVFVVLLSGTLGARQPFSAQIQQAINQITNGVITFVTLGMNASSYINWGTGRQSSGYGIRDNAGVIEVKSSGGAWTPIATSGTAATFPASTCAAPAISLTGATTNGIAFAATPTILNCIAGVAVTTLSASALTSTVQHLGPASATVAPYSITGDTDTGYGASAADTLALFVGSATPRTTMTTAVYTSSLTHRFGFGTEAQPGISWTANGASGFYRCAEDTTCYAADGVGQAEFVDGGFLVQSSGFLGFESGAVGQLTPDVLLSRGAANRLTLASGDSFHMVSGGLGIATTPTATAWATLGAGTTAIAPLVVTNGTNLTSAAANAVENDGAALYWTQDTTNGRAYQDNWNYFRLTGSGTGITTIADFFGATGSGIPLVANGIYQIEWNAYFSQATAGTATWTVTTATTALANITGNYLCSNIAGIGAVGAPQMAGINTTSSSATAFPVTGTEADAATHQCKISVILTAGNGASNTRLRLTMSAGTATPLINSYFRVRRLPAANTGTFAS